MSTQGGGVSLCPAGLGGLPAYSGHARGGDTSFGARPQGPARPVCPHGHLEGARKGSASLCSCPGEESGPEPLLALRIHGTAATPLNHLPMCTTQCRL